MLPDRTFANFMFYVRAALLLCLVLVFLICTAVLWIPLLLFPITRFVVLLQFEYLFHGLGMALDPNISTTNQEVVS